MILAGLLMVVVSITKLSRFITLLPSPVMLGFCNGLAIVIGLSQIHPFSDPHTHHWKEGAEMIWMLVICFLHFKQEKRCAHLDVLFHREMLVAASCSVGFSYFCRKTSMFQLFWVVLGEVLLPWLSWSFCPRSP